MGVTRKELHNAGLSVLLFLSLILVAARGSVATRGPGPYYYVAPNGNDDNSGTISEPFRTLTHAQTVARQSGGTDVTVYLRAGTYFLADTLRFDQRDSGMAWAAYPGERVTLSGGVPLVGWSGPDSVGRWVAHSDLDNFRQVYVNGVRAARSRVLLTNPIMTVSSDTINGSAGFVIATDITT